MKITLTLVLIVITLNTSLAQNIIKPSKSPVKQGVSKKAGVSFPTNRISPYSAFLVTEMQIQEKKSGNDFINDSLLIKKYGLIQLNQTLYVNAFLLVTEDYNPEKLSNFGFLPGSRSGQIITGLIPIGNLVEISKSEYVNYVQIGEPVKPLMDNARAVTWTNWVHQGYQLPQSYDGSGVVIGIIDGGFDYTHPAFYDSTYSSYRIKRVWEQNSSAGTPPNGFAYGRELKTKTEILDAQTDEPDGSHGTHVAGIAAGGGAGLVEYKGVAPQSDLVLVSYKSTTSIADGIAYIFDYANSVGKPCVINMSLGTHSGPHDGTSIFDQTCDVLVGKGKLLVGAAGNEGTKPLYIEKSYTLSDTVLYSLIAFIEGDKLTNGRTVIDIWGNQGKNFWVAVNIYNTDTNTFEDWTPYISAYSDSVYSYILKDDDLFFPDECIVNISTEINPLNNKPRATVSLDHTEQDDSYRWAMIEIIAYDTHTKMWANHIESSPGYAEFYNFEKGYPWVSGSTNSTIGEIGGTGKNIISVGAFTSKNTWIDFNGIEQSNYAIDGAIAPFSSKGPTADGRAKPDITAPGNVIVSAVNSFDKGYANDSEEVVDGLTNGTTNWWFATMQGTSMAAPMVTGIIALWLQAYPDLTPSQVKAILKDNAWTDDFTGIIPVNGSNTWGWGKIDAHEGIKDLLTVTSLNGLNKDGINISIFPNPSDGQFNIRFSDEEFYTVIEIHDMTGKQIHKQILKNIGTGHIETVYLNEVPNGIYNLKVGTPKYTSNHRLLFVR